ncbi:hypothetical protein J2S57_006221 [Kineosporia succinea]|uniref:Uncharacterized protein n=1 Tax=Kineosporia succinea TaxID=84632 RepID=A0ABT9PCN9_9ACTN|nr:hypothetical protein [Kineosporia succinea]
MGRLTRREAVGSSSREPAAGRGTSEEDAVVVHPVEA